MDVKGANPFLFTEDENPSNAATSNPFLFGDDDYQDGGMSNENPFLSQSATASITPITTNPFAFDPMDLEPAEAEIPNNIQTNVIDFATSTANYIETQANVPISAQNFVTTTADYIETQSNVPILPQSFAASTQNYIETQTTVQVTAPSQDFFSSNNSINQDVLINISGTGTSPQKPTELNLAFTNQVANSAGPPRPPPPRPPTSKETQDLLMSVMGAMDATSSHLLDRIPPTRTPSPVSMRDLRSPSPTVDAGSEDLLDVSDDKPPVADSNTNDLLSLNTNKPVSNNLSQPTVPTRPNPPIRPPRPVPPQKPPPPATNVVNAQLTKDINSSVVNQNSAPPKPPPPAAAVQSPAQQIRAQDEMMDFFTVENAPPPQPKPPATKADILNLYNAPSAKQQETKPAVTDLLIDNLPENDVIDNNNSVFIETVNNVTEPVEVVENQVQEPVKDNFISPEPSQNDFQLDTSDSQSKGSVSSVTFNPFAATEDNNQHISPVKQNEVFIQENSAPIGNAFQPESTTPLENNVFQPEPIVETATNQSNPTMDIFGTTPAIVPTNDAFGTQAKASDEFDAFAEKFESVKDENKNTAFDAFGGNDAWGNDASANTDAGGGFGAEESFDAFLALQEPPSVPQSTPARISKAGSQESDEDKDFSVFIKPKSNEQYDGGVMPVIAPPPPTTQVAFSDASRFNPFDQQNDFTAATVTQGETPIPTGEFKRTDSQETPPTPLYDEDVSQPLQPFPRIEYKGEGWEMHLRQPNKKKITGQRFWKKIFVKIVHQPDCVLLQLFNQQHDKDPFQELPLQPCYSVSDIGAQQYDQFGKIFTVKLQYIFYKERPGVRPGQVKKAERITNKLSQFAAYAIQGDYQGVKEFGSDLKKLGLPVEHAPQVSQLMKLGSLNYEDLKQFSFCIEEALFKLQAHRDRALHYKMEEVQVTVVDELYVEQEADGHVDRQIARVRLFFLGFLTGMPDIELGINDMRRQGKEVVGRHDIIPVVTEEWIRLEDVEFHSCVQQDEYHNTHIIKFKPPDACYIELMRFRVRPPKNRELPLQLKAQIIVTGTRVELRADVLVPGFASRKLGQIPCEDVMIRFPIPECWIYLFRVEKHFRYGSVKSAHRRTGKIKGIERILGTMETLQENLIEVTSGQAKYEHQHRAIVWRCPRLPKEGQGAYTTHNMVCRIALTSYDQMPEKLAEYCYVEFTMPATQVSHTTARSVSLQNSDSDEPPEKYVRYLARHEYRVGIEHSEGEAPNAYASATYVTKPAAPAPVAEEKPAPVAEESSSDSD